MSKNGSAVSSTGLALSTAKAAVTRVMTNHGEKAPGLKMTFERGADGNYKPTRACDAGFKAYKAAEAAVGVEGGIARLALTAFIGDLAVKTVKAPNRATVLGADAVEVFKAGDKWRVRAAGPAARQG